METTSQSVAFRETHAGVNVGTPQSTVMTGLTTDLFATLPDLIGLIKRIHACGVLQVTTIEAVPGSSAFRMRSCANRETVLTNSPRVM